MAHYILLMTLDIEGHQQLLDDPHSLARCCAEAQDPEVVSLGLYGVLGQYDFVSILEAPDNEAVARFSLRVGAAAKVHITTLPAVPMAILEQGGDLTDLLRKGTEAEPTPN